MAKTVYMVADDTARGVFEDEDRRWWQASRGHVVVSPLDKANEYMSVNGGTLYRCEPISADEELVPEPRTVKAYVVYDPDHVGLQTIYAASTPDSLRVCSGIRGPIFEIEMREVAPPAEERETGWIVKSHPLGLLFGRDGFCGTSPTFFSEPTAKELAASLAWAHAVEVYRDTLEPVNGGSDA